MMAAPPTLPPSDNGTKASATKNPSSTAIMRAAAALPDQQQQQQQQVLKCPRCDSSNTKFCYYNNYSLSQPRYFCKTCRRYWTKGGALRNVPVGGGCRKSKKSKPGGAGVLPTSSLSSSSSTATPAAANSGFQLGMLPSGLFNGSNQFIGFNYPIVAGPVTDDQMYGYGSVNHHHSSSSIASSIESLSSINQDLHWKLQQQRLAMMFGAGAGGDHSKIAAATAAATPLTEPFSFQATADQGDKAEICVPRSHDVSASATAWFLEDRMNGSTAVSSSSNPASYWNGITTWTDMQQFGALQ